jgi:raffinose/stachyose/melibiose transport system substrate-binding protein
MKKLNFAMIIMLILSTMFVWAGGSKEDATTSDPVELTVWEHTPQFEPSLKATLENFMKSNPDIRVEYEIKTPDKYYALLATTIQAGEAPDLFWTNGTATTDLANMVKQDAVMDLTGKIDLSGYSDMAKKMITIDGKEYQTPGATIGTRAVFYNKAIFRENGMSVPKNFAEFEAILEKLHSLDITPLSFGGMFSWSILFHFEPILAAMAPDWLNEATAGKARVNDPRVISAFNKMLEWGDKGYYGAGYLGVDEGGQLLAFSKGKSAMTITGSWNADTLRKNNPDMEIGAFQIPTADGRRPLVVTYAAGFCVSKQTEYPVESLRLATYLASVESQQIWVDYLKDVPGMAGVTTDDPLVKQIVDSDIQVNSFYTILSDNAKQGENPTQLWVQDNVKLLSGMYTTEEFVNMLDIMLK